MNVPRCKKTVFPSDRWGAFHPHQCTRKATKDGYCKTHHPDAEKERGEKSHAKYLEKMERESQYHAARKARLATLREIRATVDSLTLNEAYASHYHQGFGMAVSQVLVAIDALITKETTP